MAPVSQLLVYYVTPQGEPVSDVISFDVKLLHKQVMLNWKQYIITDLTNQRIKNKEVHKRTNEIDVNYRRSFDRLTNFHCGVLVLPQYSPH